MKSRDMKKSGERKNHIIYPAGLIPLFAFVALFFLYNTFPNERANISETKVLFPCAYAADEPPFTKEGALTFLSKTGKKKIITIAIEIADNDYERTRGLMYRRSLPDNSGMLFIFERSGTLSFWMRNTYIPLDIIFVDKNKQIVTIQKNTKPLSYAQIPSKRNAKYAVEVNAGFSDRHGIVIGDYITF